LAESAGLGKDDISQLLYANPAWWGYLEGTGFRQSFKKVIRHEYFPRSFSTQDELRKDSDEKLFYLSRYNPNHVLHSLFLQPKNTGYNLRQCTHDLISPTDTSAIIKQNFAYRMLFRDIY